MQDLSKPEIADIMHVAVAMKASRRQFLETGHDRFSETLKGYTLLTLFEKPSLRTRVSLEVGMQQLGGYALFYGIADSPLGVKESFEDTGKVLSRMCQGVTARVKLSRDVRALAEASTVPIINALDDYGHPMQMHADLMTIMEHKGSWEGLTLAFCGDLYNNVTYDLMRLGAIMGFNVRLAGGMNPAIPTAVWDEVAQCHRESGTTTKVQVFDTAADAVAGADVVYTDSWMSYGINKEEEEARKAMFMPFQVTAELMKLAKPDCIFMNCLPAMRGMEQTAEVIDGPQSVVFDQAENRLHAQKALLTFFMAQKRFAEILGELPNRR